MDARHASRRLLPSPELVKPKSDLNYVLVRRELAPNVKVEQFRPTSSKPGASRTGLSNVQLQPRDTVYVFNFDTGREHIVDPIIKEIEAQVPPNTPWPIVRIGGQVRAAGEYPLEPGMRVSDLLRAGGGLSEAAYVTDAELTRYAIVNGEYRETELLTVDLAGLLQGRRRGRSPAHAVRLLEHQRGVALARRGVDHAQRRGVFPGKYPIRRGEKLSSVLARAGGLTDLAFPEGSVFTRVELREREKRAARDAREPRRARLARSRSPSRTRARRSRPASRSSRQLRNSVPTGRLVIRLDEIVAGCDRSRHRVEGR